LGLQAWLLGFCVFSEALLQAFILLRLNLGLGVDFDKTTFVLCL
jgi:hypothetical protein